MPACSPGLRCLAVRAIIMVGVVHLAELPVAACDNRTWVEATFLEEVPADAPKGCGFTADINAPVALRELYSADYRLQGRVGLSRIGMAMQPGDVELRGAREWLLLVLVCDFQQHTRLHSGRQGVQNC